MGWTRRSEPQQKAQRAVGSVALGPAVRLQLLGADGRVHWGRLGAWACRKAVVTRVRGLLQTVLLLRKGQEVGEGLNGTRAYRLVWDWCLWWRFVLSSYRVLYATSHT